MLQGWGFELFALGLGYGMLLPTTTSSSKREGSDNGNGSRKSI
jgi:hypothetical protein